MNNQNNRRAQGGGFNSPRERATPTAQALSDDYVQLAEDTIKFANQGKKITTSKIRGILSMVSEIYNDEYKRVDENELLPDSKAGIQLLRVRMIYESGRNPDDVGEFISKTKLIEYLLDIGNDRDKFIKYAHYVEALVAYHRFFGGKN